MSRKDARRRNRIARQQAAQGRQQVAAPAPTEGAVEVQRLRDGGASVMLSTGHTVPGPLDTYTGGHVAQNQQAQMSLLGSSQAGTPYPEMPKVSPTKPMLVSMGATGTAIFSGIITTEEYNEDFYWKDGIKLFEQMSRSEGQASAITYLLELPIRRATWSIEPFSDDPVDKEIASFVQTCLLTNELKRTTASGRMLTQKWDDLLRHILMMLRFGFSAFEMCYRIEDDWVKWSHFLPLLPRTIWRWWTGEDNELVGIQQWTYKGYSYRYIDIPADKLLLFVHRQEGQNYEGVSLFRSAYQHWWYKQNYYKIQAIDIERNAVSIPVIYLPENFSDADITNAQQILANMRANENMGVTMPPGWKIEYLRNFERTSTQVQPAIDHHDVMMARSVLAQFVNLGSTETGAFALDASQKATLLAALQAECEFIEDVWNTDAIPRLVDYNFAGVNGYPKLKCGKVLAQDFDIIASALQKLVNLPTPLIHPDPELEDFLRNEMGLPKAPQSVIEAYNPTAQGPNTNGPQGGSGGDQGQQGETDNGTSANTGDGRKGAGDSSDLGDAEPGGGDGGGGGALYEGGGVYTGPLTEEGALREAARLLREAIAEANSYDAVEKAMVFDADFESKHPRIRGKFAPNGGRHPHEGQGTGHGGGSGSGGGESSSGGSKGSGESGGGAKSPKAAAPKAGGAKQPKTEGATPKAKAAGHAKAESLHQAAVAQRDGLNAKPGAHANATASPTAAKGASTGGAKASGKGGKLSYEAFKAQHEALTAKADRLNAAGHMDDYIRAEHAVLDLHQANPRHALRMAREEKAAKAESLHQAAVAQRGGGEKAGAAKGASTGGAKAGVGAKAPAEGVHERAAKWQAAHPEAPAEVKPGEPLQIQHGRADTSIDPYAKLDAHLLVSMYGEHQLGAALSVYSRNKLREAADQLGIKSLPRDNAEAVSKITAHVTGDHYSADFGAHGATHAAATAKGASTGGAKASGKSTGKAQAAPKATTSKADAKAARAALAPIRSLDVELNPASVSSAHFVKALYGQAQLATALSGYSVPRLQRMGADLGLKGRSKAALVKAITDHMATVSDEAAVRDVQTRGPNLHD